MANKPADRREARVLAMQCMCQLEVQGKDFLGDIPTFIADHVTGATADYAGWLVTQTWNEHELIDKELGLVSTDWSIKRIYSVDRNILRVAMVELDSGKAPPKVVINEAVEIAREYGTAESPKFVNAILDAVHKSRGL